ncbi:MAG: type II toxin-antitoxin system RelE/ParE family toxin [Firmicutes bacterium]|nr:type II toxin-antitoxin system RelE/ParE family toxin [Bacillota bacterium]
MDYKELTFSYLIQHTRAAEKFFVLHEDVRDEYENALKELITGEHPEKVDVKSIKGKRGVYYRIRVGNYRVVYAIIADTIVVINTLLVCKI